MASRIGSTSCLVYLVFREAVSWPEKTFPDALYYRVLVLTSMQFDTVFRQ